MEEMCPWVLTSFVASKGGYLTTVEVTLVHALIFVWDEV